MGHVQKRASTKIAGIRPRATAKHNGAAHDEERRRTLAAAARVLAEPYDFDDMSDEQESPELEAEIARLLGKA